MSPYVPAYKIELTEKCGATVVMAEPTSDARRTLAETLAGENDTTLIPPYNDFAALTLFEEQNLVVEPGGTVAYAAAARFAAQRDGVHITLLCGGNISMTRLAELCTCVALRRVS